MTTLFRKQAPPWPGIPVSVSPDSERPVANCPSRRHPNGALVCKFPREEALRVSHCRGALRDRNGACKDDPIAEAGLLCVPAGALELIPRYYLGHRLRSTIVNVLKGGQRDFSRKKT